jgi:hypothetical protein
MTLPSERKSGKIRLYATNDLSGVYFFSSQSSTVTLPCNGYTPDGFSGWPHGRALQKCEEVHQGPTRKERSQKEEGTTQKERQKIHKKEKATRGTGAMTLSERINDCFNREAWGEAREIILRALRKSPDDHWLISRLSTTYYEEKDYQQALQLARRAVQLDRTCPLVLWDLAGALDAIGDKEQAIKTYEKLLSRGVDGIANDECGEGEEWAKSLLADCKLRAALCYADEYWADIRAGVETIYNYEPITLACARLVAANLMPMFSDSLYTVVSGNTAAPSVPFVTAPPPRELGRLTLLPPGTTQAESGGYLQYLQRDFLALGWSGGVAAVVGPAPAR